MATAIPIQDHHGAEPENDFVEVEADTESKAGDDSSEASGSEDENGEDEGGKVSMEDMLTQVLKEIGNGELDLTDSKKLATFTTY